MNRRVFVRTFAGGLLAVPLAAEGQQPGKVYQVGTVSLGAPPTKPGIFHALDDALREQNYVEGRNLVVRRAEGKGPEGDVEPRRSRTHRRGYGS
jgi:hypothetical protein